MYKSTPKSLKTIVENNIRQDKELYIRIILIAQTSADTLDHPILTKSHRMHDIPNLLSYPLCKIPASLGNCDGTIRKTEKAALLKLIEKAVPQCLEQYQNTDSRTAVIIDGMALINKHHLSKILRQVSTIMHKHGATRADFVVDVYND